MLRVDGVGVDFLGVGGHHRVDRLLHRGAVVSLTFLSLPAFSSASSFAESRRTRSGGRRRGLLARLDDRGCRSAGSFLKVLPEKQSGPDRDRVLRHDQVRTHFVELHLLDPAASFSPAWITPFWMAL